MDEPGQAVSKRRRKRGVRASRSCLIQALVQAGLKNQTALAERMAEVEGLDAAPRHLVNRVFRELPVDPLSLERVARALGVAAHTLYLSRRDSDSGQPDRRSPPPYDVVLPLPDGAPPRAPGYRRWGLVLAGVAGIALTATATWSLTDDTRMACDFQEWLAPLHTDSGRLGLVITRFGNDPQDLGQTYLATVLHGDRRLMQHLSVLTTCHLLSIPTVANSVRKARQIRVIGRRLLQRSHAQVLLWGRLEENRLRVRFVANPPPGPPVSVRRQSAPVKSIEVPLTLDRPGVSVAKIKLEALEMMAPRSPALQQLQQRMVRTYANGSQTSPTATAVIKTGLPIKSRSHDARAGQRH